MNPLSNYPMKKSTKWYPLAGYEGLYEINKAGQIRSATRIFTDSKGRVYTYKGNIITTRIDRAGYPTLVIKNALGKRGTQYIHRLVANNFIANPHNKKFCNHKNGIKTDYSLLNLEWVTRKENRHHALLTGLCKSPFTKTRVVDLCEEVEFESIAAAARYKNMDYGTCKKMVHGLIPNTSCLYLAA